MNELLTPPLIAELTRAAEDYYGKDNVVAGGLVRLATRLVDLVHVRNAREATELARNAGCAWMGLAHVLERSDEFKRALDACHLARAFFDVDLAGCAFESARLSIVEAKVQHECGHSAEALEMLDVAASSLLSFGKKKEYIRALTTRASILIDVDRVHEASDVYSEASALASDMGDTKALAYLVSNVGVCHSRLAHYSEAEACLTTAMDMFRSLELWNEIPRARATLARVYLAKGMRQLAFSELYKCRAEFIAAGAPIVAAQVSLWIVEDKFLYEPQSDVVWLCSEMIKTFEVAGLPLQGMKALAYLNESMRQRSGLVNFAAADDSGDVIRRNISFVRQFIDQLEHRPESTFVPPMN
ncbi:MAG TPA: hypothetical protein VGF48_15690 [Thermoanaerobaculia bacterium]